jgi:Golgi nucleoside diphosphatase
VVQPDRLLFSSNQPNLVFVKDIIPSPVDENQNAIAKTDQAMKPLTDTPQVHATAALRPIVASKPGSL